MTVAMSAAAILLAIAGGAAIAIQNVLMAAVVGRGVGFTSTLIINSTIGLLVLAAIETIRSGPGFLLDIATHAKSWFVLPGLLGTFFVFAGVFGYRHLGAATTIVLIVAAQLAMGIALKLDQFAREVPTARALGNRALDILDGELAKRPFIAGEAYSIADISAFAYSHVAGDANFDVSVRKNLTAWLDRVRGQPGFAGAVIPYSTDPYSAQALPFAV